MDKAPVWVSLLVGLGAGVIGTLVSTALRISHERGSELRSRMLGAADDFAAIGDAAAGAVIDHLAAEKNPHLPKDKLEQSRQNYARLADDVNAKHTRIKLLFGPESRAAAESRSVVEHIHALDADQAHYALDRFSTAAIRQLRGPSFRRRRNSE